MIMDTPILFGGDPEPGPYRGRGDVFVFVRLLVKRRERSEV
jgi:hypothetical protein